jgi:hypothetical protein
MADERRGRERRGRERAPIDRDGRPLYRAVVRHPETGTQLEGVILALLPCDVGDQLGVVLEDSTDRRVLFIGAGRVIERCETDPPYLALLTINALGPPKGRFFDPVRPT